MPETPCFTLIMPVFNREKYLTRAWDSFMDDVHDFETIAVDDISADPSYEIALQHLLPNKVVLHNEANTERCITRNCGIEAAKGKNICSLDSDDYHLSEHLQ